MAFKKNRTKKLFASGDPLLNVSSVSPSVGAITFDVGSTLIECWPSVGHIYAEVAAKHGYSHTDPARLNRQFKEAWRNLRDFRHTRQQWADLVDASFEGLLDLRPSHTFFPQLYDRFAESSAWRIFDDVIPTLTALKERGLSLGIISNWDARLRPLLRHLGLASLFDAITISCEVGEPKPSPIIFKAAAESLGVAPFAIVHIGDDPQNDFEGARNAGFRSLLLERGLERARSGRLRSLRELLDSSVLEDMAAGRAAD